MCCEEESHYNAQIPPRRVYYNIMKCCVVNLYARGINNEVKWKIREISYFQIHLLNIKYESREMIDTYTRAHA